MGSMGLTWTAPDVAANQVKHVREVVARPFQVNFALAFPPTALSAALDAGAPIVSFSWGDPSAYLGQVRASDAFVGVQVTSPAGARRALDLGADFLICQGLEAGGHVQSTTPLWDLLGSILQEASGTPVIASGGIAHGKAIAQALAAGASGAMLGTRFVACLESRAHPEYKRRLVESQGPTSLTVCFDGGWPYSAHRVLRNTTLERWEAAGSPAVGSRPGEGDTVSTTAGGEPIYRYESAAPRRDYDGDIEAMCLYAGTGCSHIADVPPAEELVTRLWSECLSAIADR